MTHRPDPTPDAPPERIDDWAAWSAAQMARLHPKRTSDSVGVGGITYTFKQVTPPAAPTPDDWRLTAHQRTMLDDWENVAIYNRNVLPLTLDFDRVLHAYDAAVNALDAARAARAERDALAARLVLSDDENAAIELCLNYHTGAEDEVEKLLSIIDRLTDGSVYGEPNEPVG